MAARRSKEAGGAFLRAAARAGDAGRRVEEASLLEQAAECFERCGDPGARFEALLARAETMIFNDLGEATLVAVHAAEKAARNDDERMRALLRKARYLSDSSDAESAVQSGRAGIALARKAKRGDLTLPFSVVVAGGLCDLRRVDEALALLEPFREMEIAAAAPSSRVEYLIQLGITLDLANRLADAVVAFDDARGLAAAHGLKDLLASTLSNLATTTSKRGDLGRAIEFGRQGLQLWHESELLKGRPMQTQALLAHRLRDIGHYDEAVAMLEEALEEFRRAGTRPWIFATAHRLALAYAHLGQHARAIKLLAEDPADQPVKTQAVWIAHRAEVARLAGGAALKPIRVALSMLGGDVDDGNNRLVSLFGSAIVPPAEGESMAIAIAAWAAARERFGMAIAAHVRAAGCALAQGAAERARPQVEAALRLFADHQPDNFYRAELWWVAAQVFRAAGRDAPADRMLAEGRQWVLRIAAQHVRAEYRDSFLHRNPVNRALLAAAGGS
jgi:tetratricopeptide (TPR) repeat protein